eukprot:5031448-Pyramimonas_sp.AAC.1
MVIEIKIDIGIEEIESEREWMGGWVGGWMVRRIRIVGLALDGPARLGLLRAPPALAPAATHATRQSRRRRRCCRIAPADMNDCMQLLFHSSVERTVSD